MSLGRVLLSIIFPPLAVLDKGCGSILIVFILTIVGWVPGVIAALVILSILFSVFKFFIGLLPAALIVALIIWLIAKFSGNKKDSTDSGIHNPAQPTSNNQKRKKARDVSVKDVEDKEDNKNG